MNIGLTIRLRGVEALRKKEVNDILKESFHLMGLRWWKLYLPQHFGDQAQRRYGYARRSGQQFNARPRKGSYQAKKLRAFGHQRPLEFTGEAKRQALASPRITSTRDKVTIRLPRKFNWRATGSQVRMADEIRAVRPDELRDLKLFLAKQIRESLRLSGAKQATVTIRQEN